jgi:hypothetical protein
VDVYLSVTDLDGNPVTDLERADFSLQENDVAIPDFDVGQVEHPLLIGIVIDSAVSFQTWEGGAPRVEQAKEASRWLVGPEHERLGLDDEAAIFAFQDGQPVRLVDFTYDHQLAVDQGISPVSAQGNQYTALFDILRQAIRETSTRPEARRRVLLVFSDGVDRTSGVEVDRVIEEAVDAHLLIYTVGLGPGLAPDRPGSAFLRRLADETGGQYTWYRPGRADEEEVLKAFLDNLVAQRAGYRVSYMSKQYTGSPEIQVFVQEGGARADDSATYDVPPLAPVVTVDDLSSGQVLVGTQAIQPSIARAQREIDRVEYYLDDALVHTARAAPWAFTWDTAEHASSATEAERHTLRVVVCDIGDQCGETSLTLGTRLPLPTPTPSPISIPTPQPPVVVQVTPTPTRWDTTIQPAISIGAFIVALGALVALLIFMRRGGVRTAGDLVAEVRRRTRVFRKRTGIFGAVESFPQLTVISDSSHGQQFDLEESAVFLGREEDRADIVFYWDQYVSGRHAKISQEGTQFFIWDMNSANGTWVNEERVPRSLSEGLELTEAFPLHDGDTIRLGPHLKVRFDRADRIEPETPIEDDVDPARVDAPTQVLDKGSQSESDSDHNSAD